MTTFRQRWGGRAYTIVHFFVRLLAVVLLLGMGAFVFLRVHGVPGPLLREVIHRFNAAGVPVDIESVRLTFRGWRATDVRYYSRHPDDLKPIIHASEVLFKRMMLPGDTSSDRLVFDVVAKSIVLSPSVEWGVVLPQDSALRTIESAQVAVSFLPDRILLSDGILNWTGIDFHVDGAFLRKESAAVTPDAKADVPSLPPPLVSADTIRKVERWLKSLELNDTADVDVEFLIDASNLSASTLVCSSLIKDFVFRDVAFSRAEIAFEYDYPQVMLQQASLYKDNQLFRVEGSYALDTQLAQVFVSNHIQSKRMLLLFPQRLLSLLTGIELGFERLPEAEITLGPAVFGELLNRISGSFNVRNAHYKNLKIESLIGHVKREKHRLEFVELQGVVGGQEHRKDELGSCMVGGSVAGEVFWDASTHEYGVLAEGSFDPNLLLEPLSFNMITTNIIRRFRFKEQPPQARIELGHNYSKRHTFFITVQGSALDVFVNDVPFTSVNTSVAYKHGVLTIDPVVAKQGADFVKGVVALDFRNDLATFDAMGSISPEAMEDLIYPRANLFGSKIRFEGKTKITARGCVDWRHMLATDFEAQVEAEHCKVPVGLLDDLTTSVTGKGPDIRIHDATFSLYGGEGSGDLSLRLDPHEQAIPYTLDVALAKVDLLKFLHFFRPDRELEISGDLFVEAQVESDFSRNFFDVTHGRGRVDVKDGQLADLPLFSGFSKLMRKVIPSFNVFSINSLSGDFEIKDGVIFSENAYFDGDLLSAKGQGNYSVDSGFNAYVQAQVFSENRLSKVLRVITDPFFKLLEMKLEGPLSAPSWHLDKFSGESDGKASAD